MTQPIQVEQKLYLTDYEAPTTKIRAGFIPYKAQLIWGEPLQVTFTVENLGTNDFKFEFGGDYRGIGRHDRFKIVITDASGNTLPDPRAKSFFGGGFLQPINLKTGQIFTNMIRTLDLPIILDADGLTALATQPKTLPIKNGSFILTPHPGEMARLTRSQIKEVLEDRVGLSRNFSQSQHVFLVLKGHPTLITTPKGEVFINPTGNPGMASGGTGDVLAGMIGGLVCQGFDVLPSLQMAVYVHGMAGDEVAQEIGEKSLIATDIIEKIPNLLKRGI